MGLDSRIGTKFLQAGLGWGGYGRNYLDREAAEVAGFRYVGIGH
nr:hypothetical protein [Spirulina subsalsa]